MPLALFLYPSGQVATGRSTCSGSGQGIAFRLPGRKKFLLPQGKRILPRIDFPFKDLKRTFKDLKHTFKDLKHTFKVFERKIVLGRREFFTPKAGKRTAIQRKNNADVWSFLRRCFARTTPLFLPFCAVVLSLYLTSLFSCAHVLFSSITLFKCFFRPISLQVQEILVFLHQQCQLYP